MATVITSCEDMNELHDPYLKNGERDYVGQVDSVYAMGGKGRIKIQYYITDPRSKKLQVSWRGVEDNVKIFDIPEHEVTDPIEIVLGDVDKLIEQTHEFTLICQSLNGVPSVPATIIGNVYGDYYADGLINRKVKKVTFKDGLLTLIFNNSVSELERGIEMTYSTMDGTEMIVMVSEEELSEDVIVEDIDVEKGLKYRTVFLPEEEAIDMFYAAYTSVTITSETNVSLGKNVLVSGKLRDGFEGENAVDGIVDNNNSRWLNANVVGDHWLIVDLGQVYSVDKIKLFINEPAKAPGYKLQVEVGDEWQDVATIDNVQGIYEKKFDPISSSRVRLYFTNTEAKSYLRLFEIEVYTTIEY